MKCIELTKGMVAIVDDEDFEYLAQWRWHCSHGYATRGVYSPLTQRSKPLRMHVAIMKPPDGFEVDHRNLNTLDNRRSNLRMATDTQNKWNKTKYKNNTTGFKGVFRNRNGFQAKIRAHKKQYCMGTYATKEEAAAAYNAAALRHHGEFARLN